MERRLEDHGNEQDPKRRSAVAAYVGVIEYLADSRRIPSLAINSLAVSFKERIGTKITLIFPESFPSDNFPLENFPPSPFAKRTTTGTEAGIMLPTNFAEMLQNSTTTITSLVLRGIVDVHDYLAPYKTREMMLGIDKVHTQNRREAYEAELLLVFLQKGFIDKPSLDQNQREILTLFPNGVDSLHPEIRSPRTNLSK